MNSFVKKVASVLVGSSLCLSVGSAVFAESNSNTQTNITISSEQQAKADVEQIKKEMQAAARYSVTQQRSLINENNQSLGGSVSPAGLLPTAKDIWSAGAGSLKLAGLDMAGTFLDHSLETNPSSLTYAAGSSFAEKVHVSSNTQAVINTFKSHLPTTGDFYSEYPNLTLNSSTDLFLALNKVTPMIAAEKVNGTWKIYTRIWDVYDFEWQNYKTAQGVPAAFVTLVNNSAYVSQVLDIITPFDIFIYLQDSK